MYILREHPQHPLTYFLTLAAAVLEWSQRSSGDKPISIQIDRDPDCTCAPGFPSSDSMRQADKKILMNISVLASQGKEWKKDGDWRRGRKLRVSRMDDNICLCLPATDVYCCETLIEFGKILHRCKKGTFFIREKVSFICACEFWAKAVFISFLGKYLHHCD